MNKLLTEPHFKNDQLFHKIITRAKKLKTLLMNKLESRCLFKKLPKREERGSLEGFSDVLDTGDEMESEIGCFLTRTPPFH